MSRGKHRSLLVRRVKSGASPRPSPGCQESHPEFVVDAAYVRRSGRLNQIRFFYEDGFPFWKLLEREGDGQRQGLENKSGRRESNPRRPAWEVGCQLNLKTHHVSGAPFRSIKNPTKSLSLFNAGLNAAEMRQKFWSQEFHPYITPAVVRFTDFADITHR